MLAAKSVMARLAIASIGWAMLSAHLRALARELSHAALMDRLAKVSRELYFANTMQPIEMGEHIPGLWLSGRLSKPGEHDRAQIFPRQQQGIQFGAAVLVERLGQPLVRPSTTPAPSASAYSKRRLPCFGHGPAPSRPMLPRINSTFKISFPQPHLDNSLPSIVRCRRRGARSNRQNPECRFQLFNLPAQGGLRDVERFGRLPKTSGPGDFRERTLIVADRKSDNKKVSFDRAIRFELFMIPLQMRGMQETKEFDLDLVYKCSARVSPPLIANLN